MLTVSSDLVRCESYWKHHACLVSWVSAFDSLALVKGTSARMLSIVILYYFTVKYNEAVY